MILDYLFIFISIIINYKFMYSIQMHIQYRA